MKNDNFADIYYVNTMNNLFGSAVKIPKSRRTDDFPFKGELCEYLADLQMLYREVGKTCPTRKTVKMVNQRNCTTDLPICNLYAAKFLANMRLHGYKKGHRVTRYFEKMPYLPYYVCKLAQNKDGHFYVVNNDWESLEYKLALLSVIPFDSPKKQIAFEAHIAQYIENNKT